MLPVLSSTPLLYVALPQKLFPEPSFCFWSGICFFYLNHLSLQTPCSRSGSCPDSFLYYLMLWQSLLPRGTLGHFQPGRLSSFLFATPLPHDSITIIFIYFLWKKQSRCSAPVIPCPPSSQLYRHVMG